VVVISLVVVGALVGGAVAVFQYLELREAARELQERSGVQATPGDGQGQGDLDDLLGDLLEDVLGEGGPGAGAGPDLLACLGGQDLLGAGSAPPVRGGLPQQVRDLAQAVEDIRGLRFQHPVDPKFLTSHRTAQRVEDLFLADYTAEVARSEAQLLAALGAVPAEIDLRETRAEALGSQVVGFYIPETGELVVQAEGNRLVPLDRVILAHELTHAVADQNLEFPLPLEPKPGREDRDLAALSVLEGDATLSMQRFALTLPFQDQLALSDPTAAAEARAALRDVPYYLQQELTFPYEDGLSFVCRLFAAGGWDAVNRAYGEPPSTSAQVLFPDRYAEGEGAVDPTDPGEPGGAWDLEGRHELGAANLLWLFEAPGGLTSRALPDPLAAASAWAGGEVDLWQRGDHAAVGVALAEQEGADGLCGSTLAWYEAAFPDARDADARPGEALAVDGSTQDAVVRCTEDEVHLGIAPDLATARDLASS
jgi:hypothetical protein